MNKINENIIISIFIILMTVLVFILGFVANNFYRDFRDTRYLNGLWINNDSMSKDDVIKYTNSRDAGDWIAVNIKGMDVETALKTCEHEVGHEIFAEYCEKNMSICFELTKDIEEQHVRL